MLPAYGTRAARMLALLNIKQNDMEKKDQSGDHLSDAVVPIVDDRVLSLENADFICLPEDVNLFAEAEKVLEREELIIDDDIVFSTDEEDNEQPDNRHSDPDYIPDCEILIFSEGGAEFSEDEDNPLPGNVKKHPDNRRSDQNYLPESEILIFSEGGAEFSEDGDNPLPGNVKKHPDNRRSDQDYLPESEILIFSEGGAEFSEDGDNPLPGNVKKHPDNRRSDQDYLPESEILIFSEGGAEFSEDGDNPLPGNVKKHPDNRRSDQDYLPESEILIFSEGGAEFSEDGDNPLPGNVKKHPDNRRSDQDYLPESEILIFSEGGAEFSEDGDNPLPGNVKKHPDNSHSDPDYFPESEDLTFSEGRAEFSKCEDNPLPGNSEEANFAEIPIVSEKCDPIPQSSSTLKDSEVRIQVLKLKKIDGRRYWDKKDCCIYCEKLVTNFRRHLTRIHANEIEVGRFLASSGENKKKLLKKIKQRGNFFYNSEVLRKNSGEIIVARRPGASLVSAKDYLPCSICLAFFKRDKLYLHVKKCKMQYSQDATKNVQSQGSALIHVANTEFVDLKEKIFSIMRCDPVSALVKNDRLICEFGTRLLQKNTEVHLRPVISGKLRELGRLLLYLHKETNTTLPLQDFICPQYYTVVVNSLKKMAGYDPQSGTFTKPSLATKLGHSLRQCSDILECRAIVAQSSILKQSAKEFRTIIEKQWLYDISGRANKTLEQAKWNKPNLIPIAEDIQKMNKIIAENELKYRTTLKHEANEHNWRNLAKITLAHIILLNRRRAGEVQRITLSSFRLVHKGIEDKEVFSSLNDVEKMLTKNLYRLEIRGKRGSKVPVLLTSAMKESIDLLLSTRLLCGITGENPFIFAIPHTTSSCFRGTDILRSLSQECGAKFPKTLTSTKLRKHVATVSQLLNLQKNELEQVAQFMGHNLNVHFDFYRLPDRSVQIAKLGKLLIALEQGKIAQYHGKKLDDITVEVERDEMQNDTDESDTDDVENCVSPNDSLPKEGLASQNLSSSYEEQVNLNGEQGGKTNETVSSDNILDYSDLYIEKEPKTSFKRRKVGKKQPWSEEEVNSVMKHLHRNILLNKVPSKRECEKCKCSESSLRNRPWTQIKDFVYNKIKKMKKANSAS